MHSRFAAISIGFALMLSAPTALAAFPEDFTQSSSSSSSTQEIPTLTIDLRGLNTVSPLSTIEPTSTLTRREFTALIVEKLYTPVQIETCFWDIASSLPPHFTLVFTDVHVNDAYAKHICVAMRDGLIRGYADGSFRPDRPINVAESAKILSRAFVLAPYAEHDQRSVWYRAHIEALATQNSIPLSIKKIDQVVTAAEANDMIARLAENNRALPSRTYSELQPKPRKAVAPVKPKPTTVDAGKGTPAKSSAATSSKSAAKSSVPATASSKGGIWNPF